MTEVEQIYMLSDMFMFQQQRKRNTKPVTKPNLRRGELFNQRA